MKYTVDMLRFDLDRRKPERIFLRDSQAVIEIDRCLLDSLLDDYVATRGLHSPVKMTIPRRGVAVLTVIHRIRPWTQSMGCRMARFVFASAETAHV